MTSRSFTELSIDLMAKFRSEFEVWEPSLHFFPLEFAQIKQHAYIALLLPDPDGSSKEI